MEVYCGTEDEQYAYEERAAIMEFEGGLGREEAEQKALDDYILYDSISD